MGAKGFWLVLGPLVEMLNDTDPLLHTQLQGWGASMVQETPPRDRGRDGW